MAYSNSPKAIEKLKNFLEAMFVTTDSEISWITNNPRQFAYQVRNALKAAESLQHERYKWLNSNWKIKFDTSMVTAVRNPNAIASLIFPKAIDVFDVIDAVVKLNNRVFPIVFPAAMTDNDSLLQLYNWASKYNMGVILANTGGVVLVDTINEKCWKPEKL